MTDAAEVTLQNARVSAGEACDAIADQVRRLGKLLPLLIGDRVHTPELATHARFLKESANRAEHAAAAIYEAARLIQRAED